MILKSNSYLRNKITLAAFIILFLILCIGFIKPTNVNASTTSEFKKVAIANVDTYVNVRNKPTTNSNIVGKVYNNSYVTIKKKMNNGWYKIKSGKVKGYVKSDYFISGNTAEAYAVKKGLAVAKVNCNNLNVRKKATTKSKILTRVKKNTTYKTKKFNKTKEWVKVDVNTDVKGYVSKQYVKIMPKMESAITVNEETTQEVTTEQTTTSTTNTEQQVNAPSTPAITEPTQKLTNITQLVTYAKQFLGNPYVWGGTSLTNGCDCSGFTMKIYEHFGYYINRTSYTQIYNGIEINANKIKIGDLAFYTNKKQQINHVALYIGDGLIIHSSSEETGIIISAVGKPYAIRRIVY